MTVSSSARRMPRRFTLMALTALVMLLATAASAMAKPVSYGGTTQQDRRVLLTFSEDGTQITNGKIGWAAPCGDKNFFNGVSAFEDHVVRRDGNAFETSMAGTFAQKGGFTHKVRGVMVGRIFSSGKISGAWGASVRVYQHDKLVTRCKVAVGFRART